MDIGGRHFEFFDVIGRGAFGVVWRAREPGSETDVAVKVVDAKDTAAFVAAAFEAELLQILTAAACARAAGHVPRYVSHSASRNGSAGGTVRLAMSYVPGGALDKWLYGISDEEHKTVDISLLVEGGLPGSQQGLWPLAAAGSIVRDLLTQLAGVFGSFQPIAFHRDVSSHNVLVDFARGPSRPDFALIDFGLAVRSGSWSREWRNSNLAGDPRYWTPSAWMAFAFGFKYVATHPNAGFQHQYLVRMDHFSLGVLGLETLLALWDSGEAREGQTPGMPEVRAAWGKFWASVINLFQMFHMQGAQEVRQLLAQSQDEGITAMVTHLRQLRQALRAAAAQPANLRVAALLLVLADLIDEKGTVRWSEVPTMLSEDLQTSMDMTVLPDVTFGEAEPDYKGVNSGETPRPAQALAAPREGGMPTRIRSAGETLDVELQRSQPEAWEASPSDFLARTQTGLHVRKVLGFV